MITQHRIRERKKKSIIINSLKHRLDFEVQHVLLFKSYQLIRSSWDNGVDLAFPLEAVVTLKAP